MDSGSKTIVRVMLVVDERQVNFEIDVPASFYIGDSLQKIINQFEGIDGENHRIVFFFDN